MKILVKPHNIQIISTPVNELEVNVTKCEFEFSEEITDEFVKEAYFTLGDKTYKQIIINNQCDIPNEVLTKIGTIELGVVAYLVENEEELVRYNPKPGYFSTWEGSLKDAENSEPITPSEMEQYEQALQDGLSEVNDKIEAMDTAIAQVNNLDIDANKVGTTTTVTITDKSGTTKSVQVLDGINGKDGRDGVDGVNGKDGRDGIDGTNGRDGVDGISPTASVTKSNGTATITITDKNGTTTTTISDGTNGKDGTDGQNGTNGTDGYSPSASVSKSGSIATITITDKNGTTTATVSDGTTPDMSNYLAKDNTIEYTPTSNYNPATKKYVDDAISTAITTTLGGSY